ncbi:MAG TPA: DUF167 domain-containing protein [Candidatus Limnocylindrales bacterium]
MPAATARLPPDGRPLPPSPPRTALAGQRSNGSLNPSEVRFAVRLTPRSAADHVDGVVDGVLRVHVTAPPVEGAANHALLRVVADELGVSRRDVRLVAGAAGRTKLIVVDGMEPSEISRRWPDLALQ